MSWTGQGGFERRGYHHGNLREALVEAAATLIAEKGPAGFTIAEAARLAGVSPGAPYRHFRDAEALLAAATTTGIQMPVRCSPTLSRHRLARLRRTFVGTPDGLIEVDHRTGHQPRFLAGEKGDAGSHVRTAITF